MNNCKYIIFRKFCLRSKLINGGWGLTWSVINIHKCASNGARPVRELWKFNRDGFFEDWWYLKNVENLDFWTVCEILSEGPEGFSGWFGCSRDVISRTWFYLEPPSEKIRYWKILNSFWLNSAVRLFIDGQRLLSVRTMKTA
jgi:hypothetical protein